MATWPASGEAEGKHFDQGWFVTGDGFRATFFPAGGNYVDGEGMHFERRAAVQGRTLGYLLLAALVLAIIGLLAVAWVSIYLPGAH